MAIEIARGATACPLLGSIPARTKVEGQGASTGWMTCSALPGDRMNIPSIGPGPEFRAMMLDDIVYGETVLVRGSASCP